MNNTNDLFSKTARILKTTMSNDKYSFAELYENSVGSKRIRLYSKDLDCLFVDININIPNQIVEINIMMDGSENSDDRNTSNVVIIDNISKVLQNIEFNDDLPSRLAEIIKYKVFSHINNALSIIKVGDIANWCMFRKVDIDMVSYTRDRIKADYVVYNLQFIGFGLAHDYTIRAVDSIDKKFNCFIFEFIYRSNLEDQITVKIAYDNVSSVYIHVIRHSDFYIIWKNNYNDFYGSINSIILTDIFKSVLDSEVSKIVMSNDITKTEF